MSLVRHRWRVPEDETVPQVGEVIVGAVRAWRVVEVVPIESPVHLNDFRGILQPIPWTWGDHWDRHYPNARHRVFHGPWCAQPCRRHVPREQA